MGPKRMRAVLFLVALFSVIAGGVATPRADAQVAPAPAPAVKTPDPTIRYARDVVFRARFAKEVAAVRAVTGGHTPALIDADAEAERPWIAIAYIPGPSLAQAVDLTGALPEPLVLALGGGIAARSVLGRHR